jgi:hypothetical protein
MHYDTHLPHQHLLLWVISNHLYLTQPVLAQTILQLYVTEVLTTHQDLTWVLSPDNENAMRFSSDEEHNLFVDYICDQFALYKMDCLNHDFVWYISTYIPQYLTTFSQYHPNMIDIPPFSLDLFTTDSKSKATPLDLANLNFPLTLNALTLAPQLVFNSYPYILSDQLGSAIDTMSDTDRSHPTTRLAIQGQSQTLINHNISTTSPALELLSFSQMDQLYIFFNQNQTIKPGNRFLQADTKIELWSSYFVDIIMLLHFRIEAMRLALKK